MTRNRILAMIALVSATAAAAIVAGGARSYSSAPTDGTRAVTVTHYARSGAKGRCSDDKCEVGYPHGPTFQVPAGGPAYTAVITVSLQYTTTGRGVFGYRASLWKPNDVPFEHVEPRDRALGAATSPQSATLVWRVRHLVPGAHYSVRYGPDIRPTAAAHISTYHVLVVVTASPDTQS